jgi:hypothetical protein
MGYSFIRGGLFPIIIKNTNNLMDGFVGVQHVEPLRDLNGVFPGTGTIGIMLPSCISLYFEFFYFVVYMVFRIFHP